MPVKPKRKPSKRRVKRFGSLSKIEKQVIAQVVHDSPAEVTPQQVSALALTLRRSPEAIRNAVADARESFSADALNYVEIHKQTVEAALKAGDSKSLEVARKGSAWAITNIAHEGKRVIDRPESGPQGSKIIIGIRIGGIKQETVEALPLVEGATVEVDA